MTDLLDAPLTDPSSFKHRRGLLRLITASIALFALLLALAACTQTDGEETAATAPVATAIATATAAASPLAETKPAPTTAPTEPATASPTATLLPIPPTVTPQPTATPTPEPTATPLPTPTPRPPIPDSTRFELGSGLELSVSPENAFAGRDVSFSLAGVPPWAKVSVTFVDPHGVPAPWITPEDVHLLEVDRTQATTYQMFPPLSGILEWGRYGTLDETGDWSVEIELAGSVYSTTYKLKSVVLHDFETVSLGTLLTKRPAPDFTVYYSDLVPTALVADLQDHLLNTASLMASRIQTKLGTIPDIYLAGNRELMSQVSSVTGIDLGFEDGYYTNFGERPGIFMRTDLLGTEVRRLLTHEYIHHVFDGLSNGQVLPAWLTEGLSEYYEFDIALSGPRPDASLLRLFASADLARSAAQSGNLFSLATLEDQTTWNSRTDQNELSLQYAQAYMTVRFLNETYGLLAGKDLVEVIATGAGLSDAINSVTGLDIGVFESQMNRWLADWEDGERRDVAAYLSELSVILTAETANSNQRAENLTRQMTANESIRSRAVLASTAKDLLDSVNLLNPPEKALALHQESQEHLSRVLDWLTLELRAAEDRDNNLLAMANDMIPELTARNFNMNRNLASLKFVFNLPD